jgi:pSer/pThr/pTyr-binding forkhead associated (FHA) protein
MARLKVRLRGQPVSEIKLRQDKIYTAGRKDDSDILLQGDTGISREHFQILFQDGQWRLNVTSRFGDVLVGSEKVQTLNLEENSFFSVPPYEFEFSATDGSSYSKTSTQPAAESASVVRSIVALQQSPANFQEDKTYSGQQELVPVIKLLDENQNVKHSITLDEGEVFLAGRENSCQIHINDQRVSRRQFEIRHSLGLYTVCDLGSVNGTYLNAHSLQPNEPVALKSGDVITVLNNQIVFELHDPQFQNLIQQASQQANLQGISNENWSQSAPTVDPSMYHPSPQAKRFNLPFELNRQNKIRIGIGALALVLVIGALSGSGDKKTERPAATANPKDPAAKLTPEQKMMAKHHYQLAENYLAQQKWMLAKGEVEKIKELMPQGYQQYERTKDLENNAEQGMLSEQEMEKLDAEQQQQKVQQEKIQLQVAECRKKINPEITKEEMEICLQPVLQFNPDDVQIQQLRSMVDQIVTEKLLRQEKKKESDRQASQLRVLFQKAEREEHSGDWPSAIASYEQVSKSSLTDRDSYKSKALRQMATLRSQMSAKTASMIADAEKNTKEQQYKIAILTLKKAKKMDPNNPAIDEKLEENTRELKKQMLLLFQEGILEEGFGNIEGSEGKPGAKDKWKKVLEQDIPDGEYYQKAKQRLKKYGVM